MNTFTCKFNKEDLTKIKDFFTKENCSFTTMQYAFFKAVSKDFNAVFYTSGKLVIQGKSVDEAVEKLNREFNLDIKIEKMLFMRK